MERMNDNFSLSAKIAESAAQIVGEFSRRGLTVCGAESCTGGAVASAIVSIPHASNVFKGSAVCYCDAAKEKILGVSAEILQTYFAESPQCAEAMARGAAELYCADTAYATTGFLDSNTGGKPAELAGTVFLAVFAFGKIHVEELKLDQSAERNFNRKKCVLAALEKTLEIATTPRSADLD